jgi:hypothetical protein
MFAGLLAGLVEGLGQAVKGNGDIPILAAAGDVVSEAGSRIRGMGAAGSSNEASAQTSESAGFFGSISNWISGSAGIQRSEVAAVGVGEKLGRSAAHHNGTFVHAPLGRFDHNPAEAFQVPNVGMDAAMAQARAAMAGAMTA